MFTNEEQIEIMDRVFSLLDVLIKTCFCPDEKQTRLNFSNYFTKKLKTTKDSIEYAALMDAQSKLANLSFEEIEGLYEILNDWAKEQSIPKIYERDPKMRSKILKSEENDCIDFREENGAIHIFYMRCRIAYNSKYYVYLSSMELMKNDAEYEGTFFEYIVGEHSKNDKLVMIEDEKLIKELRELL